MLLFRRPKEPSSKLAHPPVQSSALSMFSSLAGFVAARSAKQPSSEFRLQVQAQHTHCADREVTILAFRFRPGIDFSMARTDAREQPAYTLAEAARYLKVAPATLRSWVVGRPYPTGTGTAHSKALIRPAKNPPVSLSFWNLIEAHVLRSLRTDHAVPMDALRRAINYAEKTLNIERLLLSPELRTDAGKLLLERYGQLIELSASGQIAMRSMFKAHLERVEWDEWKFPVRLYPFTVGSIATEKRPVAITADVAFGRPVLVHGGVTTAAIAGRIDAGESIADLADDYDLTVAEIEDAVLYERAA
ncbi:MAG: DUF433 domain-containing protein [Gammaproteobacteria bacterium]|nr:DUF433 domain-containing protein [Gammaproteobacteria bacterium]